MSDSNVDPALIKKTQDTLGKYIKKPALTDKLLNKPPFRFLFDIFNAVIRETGYFEGLYSVEEQNIDNIKTKEDKMKHLQKMIDVIEIIQAKSLHIRASKIVAGQEADKTNELLQAMAEVVKKKLNWREAVKAVLGGKKSSSSLKENKTVNPEKNKVKNRKSQKEPKEIPKEIKKTNTETNLNPREKKSIISLKEKREVDTKARKEKKNKESIEKDHLPNDMKPKSQTLKKDNIIPLENKAEIKETGSVEPITPQTLAQDNVKTSPEEITPKGEDKLLELTSPEALQSQDPNPQTKVNETDKEKGVLESRPSSNDPTSNSSTRDIEIEKNQKIATEPAVLEEEKENPVLESSNTVMISSGSDVRKRESTFTRENSKGSNIDNINKDDNRPRTSLRPPSARPPSARPAAPRRRDKNVEIILQPNEQIKMADISVRMERFEDFENDGENLVILESENASEMLDNKNASKTSPIETELEQKGHLVQQILETQKDLMPHQQHNLGEKIEKDSELTRVTTSNLRQSSDQQLANLRDLIQNLTKSVNPFGKLMDFIPEDIDEMQIELNMWRDSYAQSSIELKKEKSLTEAVIQPIKHQLTQITADIAEYNELIDSSRAKILQNSEKIMNMLLS